MPRRIPLKPRQKKQGLNFVIKYLRMVIEDEKTPAWLRVVCIDRLSIIDHCYEVNLLPVNYKIEKRATVAATGREQEQEEVAQLEEPVIETDLAGKEVLDAFNKRFFNGGKNG